MKLGMKTVMGITRVTIKKSDDVIFAISNPEVLKSGNNDNCYVVFGTLFPDCSRPDELRRSQRRQGFR